MRPSASSVTSATPREDVVGHGVGGRLCDRAAERRADRLSRRPGEVQEREGIAVVEPTCLGHVRQEGHSRRVEGAEGDRADDDHDREDIDVPRQRQHDRRTDRAEQRSPDRHERAEAVGHTAHHEVVEGLQDSCRQPDGSDADRAGAERREPERPEHPEGAEEQRGQEHEPDREQHAAVAHGGGEHPDRLRLVGAACRCQDRERGEPE